MGGRRQRSRREPAQQPPLPPPVSIRLKRGRSLASPGGALAAASSTRRTPASRCCSGSMRRTPSPCGAGEDWVFNAFEHHNTNGLGQTWLKMFNALHRGEAYAPQPVAKQMALVSWHISHLQAGARLQLEWRRHLLVLLVKLQEVRQQRLHHRVLRRVCRVNLRHTRQLQCAFHCAMLGATRHR